MLPEEYIVTKFENKSQQKDVHKNYYSNKDFRFESNWKYIICSKWSMFDNGSGASTSFNNTIYGAVSHLPILTYKQWKKMKESEIDFTIKGTKLPDVEGIKYRCVHWDKDDDFDFLPRVDENYYSFGSIIYNDEIWILFDFKDYDGTNYYMAKLSDIQQKASEQEIFEKDTNLNKTEMNKINCTIEGNFNLIKAFIADSGIDYLHNRDVLKSNLQRWPYLVMGVKGKWETTMVKNNNHFILPEQYNEALEYVKNAFKIVKTFKLGKYEAVVKNGEISIKGKGVGTVEEFNNLMESLTTIQDSCTSFSIGGYEVALHSIVDNQEFSVGCVENIPFKDMKAMYEYTKTL